MSAAADYDAYVTALRATIDLPQSHANEREAIERRARDEIAALDRERQDAALRWTQYRDTSSRLARRVNELATKAGTPPPRASAEPLAASAIPTALEALRIDLDRAEQSWQWLERHRDRVRTAAQHPVHVAPPITPAPAPAPAPPPPEPAKPTVSPAVLIGAAVALIVVVLILILAMM
ncbi:hypothetical protein L2K20_20415 [Mycobacterium sp. MBM]|nr:hypothetical protein [Mycobacterium sp. MBM]